MSDPTRVLSWRTVDRTLSSMLLIRRVLIWLVLWMGVRTPIWRKHIVTSASASLMHRQCVTIVATGLDCTAEHVRDRCSPSLQRSSSAPSEEGDGKEYQPKQGDTANYASSDGADLALLRRCCLGLVLGRYDLCTGDVVGLCLLHVGAVWHRSLEVASPTVDANIGEACTSAVNRALAEAFSIASSLD